MTLSGQMYPVGRLVSPEMPAILSSYSQLQRLLTALRASSVLVSCNISV
jgi:hypothetical protein